jgi:hypothetical protein
VGEVRGPSGPPAFNKLQRQSLLHEFAYNPLRPDFLDE